MYQDLYAFAHILKWVWHGPNAMHGGNGELNLLFISCYHQLDLRFQVWPGLKQDILKAFELLYGFELIVL